MKKILFSLLKGPRPWIVLTGGIFLLAGSVLLASVAGRFVLPPSDEVMSASETMEREFAAVKPPAIEFDRSGVEEKSAGREKEDSARVAALTLDRTSDGQRPRLEKSGRFHRSRLGIELNEVEIQLNQFWHEREHAVEGNISKGVLESDSGVTAVRKRLYNAELELAKMEKSLTAKHPDIQATRGIISAARRDLETEIIRALDDRERFLISRRDLIVEELRLVAQGINADNRRRSKLTTTDRAGVEIRDTDTAGGTG